MRIPGDWSAGVSSSSLRAAVVVAVKLRLRTQASYVRRLTQLLVSGRSTCGSCVFPGKNRRGDECSQAIVHTTLHPRSALFGAQEFPQRRARITAKSPHLGDGSAIHLTAVYVIHSAYSGS
ncbi:hypothetical protein MRX96_022006 [Rhipicephalus microplus]